MSDDSSAGGPRPEYLNRAAYMVGRYGPTVGLWLDRTRDEVELGMPRVPGRRGRPPGRGSVAAAIRQLAVESTARPVDLLAVQRLADALGQRVRRMWRAHAHGRLAGVLAAAEQRSEGLIDRLTEAVSGLVPLENSSADWLRLGTAVAEFRRACRRSAASDLRMPIEIPRTVVATAGALISRCDVQSLRGLISEAEVVRSFSEAEGGGTDEESDPPLAIARPAYRMSLELARLDRELISPRRPEPVLVLLTDRLVFRGTVARTSRLGGSELAALWVLAERAGECVSRLDILEGARIQSDEHRLKEVVSRLRIWLRGMGNGLEGLAELIVGDRRRGGQFGPYRLDLNPSQVRVAGPVPGW